MLKLILKRSLTSGCGIIRPFSAQVVNENFTDEHDKRRKVLELEIELMRQEGRKVPTKFSPTEWERIFEMPSISARRRLYSFLFNCEMTNLNKKAKKEIARKVRDEKIAMLNEESKDKPIVYALGQNSIFMRFYDSTLNLWNNNKLVTAMQFEQKVVIDCSYDKYMTLREADNCAKQLSFTFATNRIYDQPFDLHFCNFEPDSKSGKKMRNHIPTLLNPEFPLHVHEKSYLDVFDKEKLVYLTPHCRNSLTEYNHDDIYIIGAMVDKSHNEPLSLAKAKKDGLRMAKFPIDEHFRLKGGKCLTINQVLDVLATMRDTNDWEKALLKHLPRRKISTVYSNNEDYDYGDEEVNLKNKYIYSRNEHQYTKYNDRYKNDNSRYQQNNKYINRYNDRNSNFQENEENFNSGYRKNNANNKYNNNRYNERNFRENEDENFNNGGYRQNSATYNNSYRNDRRDESFNNKRNNYNNRLIRDEETYNSTKNAAPKKKGMVTKIFDED